MSDGPANPSLPGDTGGPAQPSPARVWGDWFVAGVLVAATASMSVIVWGDGSVTRRLVRIATIVLAALGIWLLHRRRRLLAVPPFAVAGIVVTATGYAVGWERLRVADPSFEVLVGLAAFASGISLLAWACYLAAGSLRGWRKVSVVVLGVAICRLALLDLVILPVAAGITMVNVPRQALEALTPAVLGLTYRSVSFPAEDGVVLRGWYVPSRTGRAVVLVHGASSNRSSVLAHAGALAEHGYGVLLFDSRGQGESAGTAMDLGWYGDEDISGAVTYLRALPDVDPARIALVGLSLGGEEAIGEAAIDQRVRAVVAEGATYRVMGDWSPHADGGWFGRERDWLMFTTADVLSPAPPPVKLRDALIELAPRRALLIESGAGLEISAGQALQKAAPGNVELWELPGVDHIGGLAANPAAWEARVTAFLDRELG